MSTLHELVAELTSLDAEQIDQLHRLAGDWQMLADLSFADLLMWVCTDNGGFACVAHARPTTAATTYPDDQVGRRLSWRERPHLAAVVTENRIWREGEPIWLGQTPVRLEAFPVRRDGRVVAVLGRDTNLADSRVPSQLELSYLALAGDLLEMVAEGSFPYPAMPGELTSAPRVGDGLLRLDNQGLVTYASPNAQSACRRLGVVGDVLGVELATDLRRLADDPLEGGELEQQIRRALAGRPQRRREIEAHGATVLVRVLPLRPGGEPSGVLVLVRDVTEVRRRERQLISKDATIREIHHRVKNNLQAVASLLRLQARRTGSVEASEALAEAVRRVSAIALVHDTLSGELDEAVDFGAVLDKVLAMVVDVASLRGHVTLRRTGDLGRLPAEQATPLVLVVTELAQNAVEHGSSGAESGEVLVSATRTGTELQVEVADNGRGLPAGFTLDSAQRLGLQIVQSLVTGELAGSVDLLPRPGGGTIVRVRFPVSRPSGSR